MALEERDLKDAWYPETGSVPPETRAHPCCRMPCCCCRFGRVVEPPYIPPYYWTPWWPVRANTATTMAGDTSYIWSLAQPYPTWTVVDTWDGLSNIIIDEEAHAHPNPI